MSPTPQPKRLGIAEGVVDHPVIERTRLGDVALLALDGLFGGFLHQPVGRQQIGGGEVELALGIAQRRRRTLARDDRAVLRLDLRRDLDRRRLLIGRPFDPEHLRAVPGIAHALGHLGVARPGDVAGALPVGGREARQRDPRPGGAIHRLDPRGQHEGAPALGRRCKGDLGRREARRETEGAGGDAGLQHVATIHLKESSHGSVCRGGWASRRRDARAIPDQTRAARGSGLYRKAEGLQGGAGPVNGRSDISSERGPPGPLLPLCWERATPVEHLCSNQDHMSATEWHAPSHERTRSG